LVVREVIRDAIGFDGLVVSDDLAMAALSGSLSERAERALAAGCDLVLHCSGIIEESRQVAAGLRAIGQAAIDRLARAIPSPATPTEELNALIAKRDALLAASG
jgi:beta-N-acetylhexosaminidase